MVYERLGVVLRWCLFLTKSEARGAYSGDAYKKGVYCIHPQS